MKVTVFGSARLGGETPEYADAVRLGRRLAEERHTVMSGGYGGIMEAVSRGAREAGGNVVGITMEPSRGRTEYRRTRTYLRNMPPRRSSLESKC
jgi:uncharacterized protein (TIGR00725 family)